MTSSSGNQFSMEFIEVENGRGRKWRIDNLINEKFDGWVWKNSLWFTLKGLSSKVVVPKHGHEQGLLDLSALPPSPVKDLKLDMGLDRDDLQLGNVYENTNENFGNVYLDANENFGNVYVSPNENFGNVLNANENFGNINEHSNQDNSQGQVRNDLQMDNALEDSMDCEEPSDVEPMDSQSNENSVVHDPKYFLTYKDGASWLKEKKRMTFPELAEKVLLESPLAISNPLKDSDQREEFIRATTNMSQRLKDLRKKWKDNYYKLKEKDENEVLFDLVSFSFFFIL